LKRILKHAICQSIAIDLRPEQYRIVFCVHRELSALNFLSDTSGIFTRKPSIPSLERTVGVGKEALKYRTSCGLSGRLAGAISEHGRYRYQPHTDYRRRLILIGPNLLFSLSSRTSFSSSSVTFTFLIS
jgi:hypothetical protein